MLLFKKDIKFVDYESLLQYAFESCDILTLQVPNNNKLVINEYNIKGNSQFHVGDCIISDDPLYEIYYDNANRLMNKLFGKYITRTFFATEYLTSIYSTERKIYQIDFKQEVMENLFFTGSLFAWKFPFLPEDLRFFSEGKCWLQSIAHEETCMIYDTCEKTKSILKKMNVKYIMERNAAIDVPVLTENGPLNPL